MCLINIKGSNRPSTKLGQNPCTLLSKVLHTGLVKLTLLSLSFRLAFKKDSKRIDRGF